MLTIAPINMMLQAEEQAKHLEQNTRILAEDMQRTLPSETQTPRWLNAVSHFVARLRQKAQHQPTVTTCCVERHSCA
ncbi:hypothetical protein U14_05100 [Candidatus Moduliflexus flocculans]|uniref:Uncharacterized protein n=1 Tax=Candidatus Moduliflexus flocculans TaxID=1499966 RepID=A0A081BQZ5_9BACT|nr:hypothetical protein U14_05100 [Candidatus Moduliflexus flocculans]